MRVLRKGLLTTDVDPAPGGVSANALDAALWESPAAGRLATGGACRAATLPFYYWRGAPCPHCSMTVLAACWWSRGAPEEVLANCAVVPDAAQDTLAALFAEGRRVVAVASKPAPELTAITAARRGPACAGRLFRCSPTSRRPRRRIPWRS